MTDEKWSFLVSRLVHELRTPLGSVLMLAELLAEDLDAKGAGQTRKIRQATTDVLGLLAEVSELAKIEGGRLGVAREEIPLMELAGKLEDDYRPLAEERDLAFEIELAAELPRSIKSDRRRLEQVLGSLLAGALAATVEGRVTMRIEPGRQEEIVIAVSDTGPEVPAEQRDAFFEPFAQPSARLRREHGGHGLGLAVAAALAKRLGGALALSPRDGAGTTVTLSLPR